MRIEAHDVVAGYDGREVLRGVSLSVEPGQMVGVIGPNGAGKSTLLRALTRALPIRRGVVTLSGDPIGRLSAMAVARRVAFVPQAEPALFEFSVREVVLMGRHPYLDRRGETASDYESVLRAMAATDTLHLADRPVTSLSGGEHRRVLIARALAQNAATIVLDEPTAHLDLTHQADVLALVRRLVDEQGVSVLAALHDLNLAAQFCDRLALLAGGRVAAEGTPEHVLEATLLEQAYGAPLRVSRDPTSGKPQVHALPPLGLPGAEPGAHVHLVCGGGTGLALMSSLRQRGYAVSVGVLNRLDTDHEAAVALGLQCIDEAPFSPIGRPAQAACAKVIGASQAVIVTDVPIGRGNLPNLELALDAANAGKRVLLVGEAAPGLRDFTGGAAESLIKGLIDAGAECLPDDHAALYRLDELCGPPKGQMSHGGGTAPSVERRAPHQ